MKKLFLAIMMAVGFASAQAESVLITAFDPFGGQSFNPSMEVASLVKDQLEAENFQVTVCVIPTIYDQASLVAEDCFQKMDPKPRMVLSLGEGGSCNLEIDIKSQNLDNSYGVDNAGHRRQRHVIDPTKDSAIGFNMPLTQMYCSLSSEERSSVNIGNTGDFLCNNTGFHLAQYFGDQVEYAFFHVPYSGCSAEQTNPKMIAGRVSELLTSGLTQLPGNPTQRMPTNHVELSQFSDVLLPKQDQCTEEFLTRIPDAFAYKTSRF